MQIYQTDGSFSGFLTAIFDSFNRKETPAEIITADEKQAFIFEEMYEVITDEEKANRVWQGLAKQLSAASLRILYVAYLSDNKLIVNDLYQLICRIFKEEGGKVLENFGDLQVLRLQQMVRKVEREKHRMMAFVRFQESSDGVYFATIEPDYNILPLIGRFFARRYADQPWLIYDKRRKYGYFFDKTSVQEVALSPAEANSLALATPTLANEEERYSRLWQSYFKSTNIVARKNLKLHRQHVPRRYWKYLTEKQVANLL